jgi:hypothetical protein
MNEQNERPAAQERWIICYDLECIATHTLGLLEACSDPESQEIVHELIKKAHDSALTVLKLTRMLRFGEILEAETPPEVLERRAHKWPDISPSLKERFGL